MSVEPVNIAVGDQAGDPILCTDPATGETLGEVAVTEPEAVQEAVERSRRAQRQWRATSFAERRRVLGLLLARILERSDELCEWVVRDAGKTRENAMLGEIWPVCEKLRWTRARGERHLKSERVSAGLFVHKRARIDYQPLGVIGVITPWNYPLQNILGPVIPALMAGNGCVVKPSEWVAWSSQKIGGLLRDVLAEAGHDPELIQLLQGYAETGRALIGAGIDKLVFTGSVENGRRVLAQSAQHIVPVILELGGKDALIVCDDADLEQAAHAALNGVFINAGQNCLAAERVLVFDRIADDFEQRVVELTRPLRQGPSRRGQPPVDVGAMVSPLQLERVERLVEGAVAEGARILVGGAREGDRHGQFYPPTILADVTPQMTIMQEELFGPVMLLARVFGEAEAVKVANDTRFGLGCTIMTKNPRRARRIGRQMQTGGVSVNDFGLTYMAQDLPFGGVKASGFGRLNGRDGLRAFTNPQAVLDDRLPISRPAKLYPVAAVDYDLTKSAIHALYRPSVVGKFAGAWRLAFDLGRKLLA